MEVGSTAGDRWSSALRAQLAAEEDLRDRVRPWLLAAIGLAIVAFTIAFGLATATGSHRAGRLSPAANLNQSKLPGVAPVHVPQSLALPPRPARAQPAQAKSALATWPAAKHAAVSPGSSAAGSAPVFGAPTGSSPAGTGTGASGSGTGSGTASGGGSGSPSSGTGTVSGSGSGFSPGTGTVSGGG